MVSMSVQTHGERMSHHYQYLEGALTRLIDKVNRGDYKTCRFAKEHASLFRKAKHLSESISMIRRSYVGKTNYFQHVANYLCNHPTADRVIVTVKDDSTCVSMVNFLQTYASHLRLQICIIHGGQHSSDQNRICNDFINAAGKSLLVVTDRYASAVVNDTSQLMAMTRGVSFAVLNYDAKAHGPDNFLKESSDRIHCDWRQCNLNRFTAEYKNLKSGFEHLLKKEQRALHAALDRQRRTASAVTTITRWWRRSQLALKQRAATVIQQHLRSALCRIHAKREQIAAAARDQAAKSIQIWRRSIVLQRENRKLDGAALSNPFRVRGLPLPPRSRQTLRRHKRREKGRHKCLSKNEEEPELQEPLQELRQSVQCLQESVNKLEERNQQLVDTNAQLLQELRVIRSLLSSSNNGTKIESALHTPSELSCRGNVIGKSLHNSCVSGSSRRESVLDNSHRHGGENLHPHDAIITQHVIGATLPIRSSGSESVLVNSRPSPISSPRGKSSRRRRRRRRQRYRRWKRNKRTLSNKGTTIPTPNHSPSIHPVAIDCNTNTSIQPTAVNSKSSGPSRSSSLDETHSISSTSISSPSSPVVSSKLTTSELETPIPIVLNELQPSSSTSIVDNSPSSTTTLVEPTPSTSITAEEEPSTCHVKPISYLSALIGTATNIG